jgi:hypothetical protein
MSDQRVAVAVVHGAFADSSSRTGVIERLQRNGVHVTLRMEIAVMPPSAGLMDAQMANTSE